MKILFLTELFDELRPNKSFIFKNEEFQFICNSFLSKANGIHTIFAFSCDHIIINKLPHLKYKKQRVFNDIKCKNFILSTTKNTFHINDIEFSKYDVIWCRDDILLNITDLKRKYPNILFVYENVEHCYSTYNKNYDLLLDHTNFNFKIPRKLNVKVSFPYTVNKKILRENIDTTKKNTIFFDNRDILNYSKKLRKSPQDTFMHLKDFFKTYNVSIICNVFRPEKSFNPNINDNYDTSTLTYLTKIAQSKYFILTYPRLGQSLVEAAALKCIVIGTKKSINSPFICHKECLFDNFASLQQIKEKILYLESKPELQKEILEYQDKMLSKHYYEYQKNVLKKAVNMKRQ